MKEIIIIGGANGSGKTTFSKLLIEETGYIFLNADEIEKELGWKPQKNFHDALKETVEWYLAHKEWWTPLLSTLN